MAVEWYYFAGGGGGLALILIAVIIVIMLQIQKKKKALNSGSASPNGSDGEVHKGLDSDELDAEKGLDSNDEEEDGTPQEEEEEEGDDEDMSSVQEEDEEASHEENAEEDLPPKQPRPKSRSGSQQGSHSNDIQEGTANGTVDSSIVARCPCGSEKVTKMECEVCQETATECGACYRRLSPCVCFEAPPSQDVPVPDDEDVPVPDEEEVPAPETGEVALSEHGDPPLGSGTLDICLRQAMDTTQSLLRKSLNSYPNEVEADIPCPTCQRPRCCCNCRRPQESACEPCGGVARPSPCGAYRGAHVRSLGKQLAAVMEQNEKLTKSVSKFAEDHEQCRNEMQEMKQELKLRKARIYRKPTPYNVGRHPYISDRKGRTQELVQFTSEISDYARQLPVVQRNVKCNAPYVPCLPVVPCVPCGGAVQKGKKARETMRARPSEFRRKIHDAWEGMNDKKAQNAQQIAPKPSLVERVESQEPTADRVARREFESIMSQYIPELDQVSNSDIQSELKSVSLRNRGRGSRSVCRTVSRDSIWKNRY